MVQDIPLAVLDKGVQVQAALAVGVGGEVHRPLMWASSRKVS